MDLLTADALPDRIDDIDHLEDLLSTPSQALVDDLARVEGDIIVLGVGGKVGPTLARLAKRAAPERRVVGVARFSDPAVKSRLEAWGIETITADLLDRKAVAALPRLPNVVYMAGRKFGLAGNEPFTWAMNVYVPGLVAEHFANSKIVSFSTLCVYPYSDVRLQACDEDTPPNPSGEYGNSCVGRERIFQYFSQTLGTPGRLMRLNYAIDMRYGVLFDVASRVRAGTPIDLTTGHANVIWQGDASSQMLRALLHCTTPATPLNIGGPDATSIRWLAQTFGRRFDRAPVFEGTEAESAWVNNTSRAARLFGYPVVSLPRMIEWVADWVARDMPEYGKPTKYEVRSGGF